MSDNITLIFVLIDSNTDIGHPSIKDDEIFQYDIVVTLCGDSMDRCPSLLSNGKKHIHWDLDDPAKLTGSEEKISLGFSKVRDKILDNIKKINI